MSIKRLSRDETRRIAANIAKLPGLCAGQHHPSKFDETLCDPAIWSLTGAKRTSTRTSNFGSG